MDSTKQPILVLNTVGSEMFASKLHEHESLKTKQNTSFDSFTTKKNLHYTVTESCIAQCLLKELIKNID